MRSILAVSALALLSCPLVNVCSINLSGTHAQSALSPGLVLSDPPPAVPVLSAKRRQTAETQVAGSVAKPPVFRWVCSAWGAVFQPLALVF
jgi:hypothetical protein